jgi:hypothetical protein
VRFFHGECPCRAGRPFEGVGLPLPLGFRSVEVMWFRLDFIDAEPVEVLQ